MKDLELLGTEFQVKVWKEISKIPYGETRTYKDLAIAIGKPKSSRAVANACGKNPYPQQYLVTELFGQMENLVGTVVRVE